MDETKDKIIDILLLLVGILAIGFSTYQTAKGYEQAAGNIYLSGIISIIISLSLVTLLLSLRSRLNNGQSGSATKIFLFYCLFAIFSIVANFNAFFTGFIKSKFITKEINRLEGRFHKLESEGIKSIENEDKTKSFIDKVNSLEFILLEQVRDKVRPGFGGRAKKIGKEIEKLLGVKLTTPYGSGEDQAASLKRQIDSTLNQLVSYQLKQKNELIEEIRRTLEENVKLITQAKSTIGINDDYEVMINSIGEFNNLVQKILGVLREVEFREEPFVTNVTELGKIPYSLDQARKEENKSASLIAFLLSLAIDFFVPFLIFVVNATIGKSDLNNAYFPQRPTNPKPKKSLRDKLSNK